MKQVITIGPGGEATSLQIKGGVSLSRLGKASISRISEIVWQEESQKWAVWFLRGDYRNSLLTEKRMQLFHVEHSAEVREDGTLLFSDYEDGVAAEVAFIQAARIAGFSHLVDSL